MFNEHLLSLLPQRICWTRTFTSWGLTVVVVVDVLQATLNCKSKVWMEPLTSKMYPIHP